MFDMFYNKHYIRINESGMIIKGFSDAFETPLDTDILINDKGGRHFEINGQVNPSLFDENMCHLYRFEHDSIRLSTPEELESEFKANYVEPAPTAEELQWQAITDLEIAQMETDLVVAELKAKQEV